MSDVKQCDRCESIVDTTHWAHNPRITATLEETSRAATAYSPEEYELCENCAFEFVDWVMSA